MTSVFIMIGWCMGWVLFWKSPYIKKNQAIGPDVYLSIIIPARNESQNLSRLLKSLHNQTFPPYEILVIDDHSTDTTAEIAKHYTSHVHSITQLPNGWLGKPHACWMGAKKATGDFFLFLDADTWFTNDGLEKLIALFLQEELDAMTVQPYHAIHRVYEHMSLFFNLVIPASLGIGLPRGALKVPAKGGFGPCFLCTRAAYFEIGGHRAAAQHILEHFELSNQFSLHKKKIRHVLGKDTLLFRMYPEGLRQLINGWSKSFISGAAQTSFLPFVGVLLWLSGCYAFIFSLGKQSLHAPLHLILWVGWYIAYGIQIGLLSQRVGQFRWGSALLFPIPLLFYLFVFVRAWFLKLLKQPVHWKGRTVSKEKKERRWRL